MINLFNYKIIITAVAFLALGIVLGMIIQQGILQGTLVKVASSLEGVEINIDLNETQIIEGSRDIAKEMTKDMIEGLNKSSAKK